MKKQDIDTILELRESNDAKDSIVRKPTFYNISLFLSILAISLILHLVMFHQRPDGMEGMFDGLQYVLGAALALGVGFVCTIIGFFRDEKSSLLHKLNSVITTLFALLVLILMNR